MYSVVGLVRRFELTVQRPIWNVKVDFYYSFKDRKMKHSDPQWIDPWWNCTSQPYVNRFQLNNMRKQAYAVLRDSMKAKKKSVVPTQLELFKEV